MSFPITCVSSSVFIALLSFLGVFLLQADTVVLHPIADTSLIQVAPDANLGGAEFFNAGTAGNGNHNHGLIQFSLTHSIPAGSTIDSVTLSLDIIRQPSVDLEPGI